ncbi:MAG: ABC transporter ATP-binding protein [Nitrospinota bacterium]|nr:MAG: ABC transporter ATP-binding protein [Nitrospinota bacterium]
MPALEAYKLSVRYPGSPTPAISELTCRVPVGTRIALVGPNGAGKSTLLKTAAGLLPVQAGEIRIYGQPVGACHHRVAYLSQRSEIDWHFPITVRRLVMTGRYVHLGWLRRPGREDRQIVDAALERLGLQSLAERQIGQLSGGQQQRVLLARALAQEADLFLLDEPLNAVDAATQAVVSDVLAELQQQGKTIIVATHDLGRLETDFDGALYLSEGHEITPPAGAFVGLPVGEEAGCTG